jgi:thioredoxin reductase (NADPH)
LGGHEFGPLLHEQAELAGAEFVLDTVQGLETDGEHRIVRAAGETLRGRAVIIAAGSALRPLGVAGEEKLLGRGVSHCASCDGPLFAGRAVCVVGGGDAALDEALVLASAARHDRHRGQSLDAQQALLSKAAASRKIGIILNSAVRRSSAGRRVGGAAARPRGWSRACRR